jgi:DNA polymerase-3 subunit gamma/tau
VPSQSLALYRRYRPDVFSDVIGQEHVTGPLQQALRNDRVHHAYLFSGPRGCGKTTSARILARSLNCVQGPTPTPCGECDSCTDLARGGPGSIDVIEIDAASYGGVEETRNLRESAYFAPARDRFKIYIVDEAHTISDKGFDALLKIVEEPPEHVKFVFATTEPDKVLATIRSRTHHYPFRLVPPGLLQDHLKAICEQEDVAVEPAVLSLVVRAGQGSVRDALSVLDQLLGSVGPDGVTYATAVALLGYTDAALLDEIMEAFAAGDGAAVFRVVDSVVESGHDPRGFAADLLDRLRDLVVLGAVRDAALKGLIPGPTDHVERLSAQAARFGLAELTRAAEIVATGLTEMRGATAPRLLLELVCARILLPEGDVHPGGLHARLDRIERRLAVVGEAPTAPSAPAASPPAATSATAGPPAATESIERAASTVEPMPAPAAESLTLPPAGAGSRSPTPGGADLGAVRTIWPQVLERVKQLRRSAWMVLFEKAAVLSVDDGRLTLAMPDVGLVKGFPAHGYDEIVRQALIDVLGVDWQVEAVLDPGRAASSSGPRLGAPAERIPDPEAKPSAADRARATIANAQPAAAPDQASPDDPDLDDSASHEQLLATQLGATTIEEYEQS